MKDQNTKTKPTPSPNSKTQSDSVQKVVSRGESSGFIKLNREAPKAPARLSERCCNFEEENGPEEILKLGLSAINRLLVEKGIVTEDEIKQAVVRELDQLENLD